MRGRIAPSAVAAPASGHRLGADAAFWHDCPHRALILRQAGRPRPGPGSPYGLGIEVVGFGGCFLSLALDLPPDALERMGPARIVQLDAVLDAERAITAYARLNLVQGPNTETVLRQLGAPVEGHGALVADRAPRSLSVVHRGEVVAEAVLCPADPGVWTVAVDLPPSMIEAGALSLLLVAGDEVLARLPLIAGTVAEDDLLAEVAQLRAELDLLKREFRRFAAGA